MVQQKDIIKVLVVLGERRDGSAVYRIPKAGKTGEIVYRGFIWDVWARIRDRLKDKYDFITEFTDVGDNNYNGFVQKVQNGEYDMVVGAFFRTVWRESRIDYLSPIAIDANAILHLDEVNIVREITNVLNKSIFMVLYLLVAGIIVGLLLFYIDPGRAKMVDLVKNKGLFLIRSILTGIATMLGEMGFMSENASLKPVGVILSVVVMIVSFVMVMFIQGEITSLLIEQGSKKITKENIQDKPLLGHYGYSVVEKLKDYGANVDAVKDISTTKLIEKYLENKEKYAGVILSYLHAYPHTRQHKNLVISHDFGDEPTGYIVSQNKPKFKEDFNREILRLKQKRALRRICRAYFGGLDSLPTCQLT